MMCEYDLKSFFRLFAEGEHIGELDKRKSPLSKGLLVIVDVSCLKVLVS